MNISTWNKVLIAVCILVFSACKTIYIDDPDEDENTNGQTSSEQVNPSVIITDLDVRISGYEQGDTEMLLKQKGISALYVFEGEKLLYGMDSIHAGFCSPSLKLKKGRHVLTTVATRGNRLDYDATSGWITAANSPYSYVSRDTVEVRGSATVPIVLRAKFAELVVDFSPIKGDRLYLTLDIFNALDVVALSAKNKAIGSKISYDLLPTNTFAPARFLVTGTYTTDVKVYTKTTSDNTVAYEERVFRDVELREGETTHLVY